jgi:starch synthase
VAGVASGFLFSEATAEAMLDAVDRALELWSPPLVWRRLQRAAMVQVFSWAAAAERYAALYRRLAPGDAGGPRPLAARSLAQRG